MSALKKQLGQARPVNTTAVSIYSPASSIEATINGIVICNTTASPVQYSIFHDEDGTTYNETTALVYQLTIDANSINTIPLGQSRIYMRNSSGNLAIKTETASALTFTVYGVEEDI